MDEFISRIDHVSIAVRDYDKAERFFQTVLRAVPGTGAEDPGTRYFWKIFSLGDMSRLELIRSTGAGSFLENFLSEREGGVHHITLQTPDIVEARKHLEKHGIPYFGYSDLQGSPWKELFIHPKDAFGVLIQIAEFDAEAPLSDSVKLARRWKIEKTREGAQFSLKHPGGGRVRVPLTKAEIKELISDLKEIA